MNLLLFEPEEVPADGHVRLDDHRAGHLIRVLGVEPQSRVRAGVVNGPVGEAIVERVDEGAVTLRWVPSEESMPAPRTDLLLALPRPKVMKRLWAQLAALRVGRIVLTNATRVERYYFDTHVLDPARYRPLLLEGLAQAQHTWLPDVEVHRQFKPLVEDRLDDLFGDAGRVLALPGPTANLSDTVRNAAGERVVLAVGPEGGWVPYEVDLLREHGFQPAGLGPLTLRSDTACIALLSVIQAAMGER
jgi:RsmE family RNA methyltransferase